jgi:hypothetical protein
MNYYSFCNNLLINYKFRLRWICGNNLKISHPGHIWNW